MKAKAYMIAPVVVTALVLSLLAVAGTGRLADAQEETPTPPPVAAPAPEIPDTLPAINQVIAKLEAQIIKLNEEADQLITLAEQDKKKKLRNQIKALETQKRILERRRDELTRSADEAGIEEIRARYRQRIRELEARNAARRRATIARYEAMLARNPNTRVAPDILWRLANLYFEEAHAEYLAAWDSYEASMDTLYAQGDIESVPREPMHNYSRSIELLKAIVKDYPQYPRKDNALYLLAYCYQEQADDDNALIIYERLIQETPDSSYVPEAYVRMGEIYFDRDQFDRAIERYKNVLNYEQSKFYDKAMYKLGWSYYKLSNYEQAVYYFTRVLKLYADRRQAPGRRAGSDDLQQESIDYIAISFTEAEGAGGARAAVQFMREFDDRDVGRQVLYKVGEVFDERTDYELARQAYRAYIEEFPTSQEVPEVWRKIAITYEKQSMFTEAVAEYEQMGETLGPNSAWAQANAEMTEEIERVNKIRQASILAAATFHHEKAQNTTGEESQAHYAKAIQNYTRYIEGFPESDNYYETAFNLAECYMETGQYPLASEMYTQVIELKKDEELWTEALFNNAKAWERQVEREGGLPNQQALTERDQASEVSADQRKTVEIKAARINETTNRWIQALLLHVDKLPKSERSPAMLYKVGEIYYLHRDFANARKYFDQVFAQYADNKVAQYAAYFYIDTYKQEEDWPGLEQAARRMQQFAGRMPSTATIKTSELTGLMTGAILKQAEKKMAEATATSPANLELIREAIALYIKGVQTEPNNKNADIALLNVAVAYENHLVDLVRANEIYLRLGNEYPQSKHAPDALLKAAYNYQILTEFDQAMRAYEKFARQWPDHKEAGNALFNAAALREEDGQVAAAIPLYEQYLSRYASDADAPQVAFSVARLREQIGDTAGALAGYEAYAKRGPDDASRMSEAYFRWGRIMETRGNWKEAEKRYLQAVAVYIKARGVDASAESRYAAESQFRIAGKLYDAYRAQVFTGNIRKDSAVLKEKAETFKQLKVQYEQIVTFGNYTWATASLHMIGMINQEFSDALLTAPIPEGLSQEQADEYMFKLEEIAFPIKNRALEAFKQNVKKGIDERLINKWIIASFVELKKIEPNAVEPKFEEVTASDTSAMALPDLDPTLPKPPSTVPTTPTGTPPATTPPAGAGASLWPAFWAEEVGQ